MRKKYILDTSVLITDPFAYKKLNNSDVVIPIIVLNELDKLKKQTGEAGRNARVAIRALDDICILGDISTGILLYDDTLISIDTEYRDLSDDKFAGFGDPTYADTQILACAYSHWLLNNDTVLLSNDINLRVKSQARAVFAEKYESESLSSSELYSGVKVVTDEEAGITLQQDGFINLDDYGLDLFPNQCVVFQGTDNENDIIAMGRKSAADKIKIIKKVYPWNLSPRNKEQSFAIDLMMDRNIDLVTLIGSAGTGKSLVVLATALELVLNKKEFDKLIIYRPIQPVGNDIGFLPGPQPLDAKIATPNGWTTMGDIKPDDLIIGSDGKSKKVLKIFPKGEKEVFKVLFSDGSSTECCEDHLWYTTTLKESQRKYGKGSVKSLKEIRETLKAYKTKINNHKIDLVKPVEFIKQDLIIDPYIMGILLGDGTLSEEYSVYFTSSDKEIHNNCFELTPEEMLCKIKNKVKDSYNYNFIVKENLDNAHRKDNIFAREIKKIGLLGSKSRTKFIPEKYKINSIENRLALLQGLMDSDGFVSADGSDVSYSTTSNQLALDIQFIVQSLGGIAHINNKLTNYSYNNEEKEVPSKVVSVSLPKDMCPFKLERKVSRFKSRKYPLHRMIIDIIPVGIKETKCILVESEDHLYATDNFILTHNTMEEKLSPWFQAIMDNFEVLFNTKNTIEWKKNLEMYQKKGRIEMEAITYIRGRSIPNAIILIDEAQNLNKEEVKTILTRAGENTKVILTGDIEQIDNSVLDASNNGLTYIIEKFKDSELAGHITFTQGERSRLASEAARIL